MTHALQKTDLDEKDRASTNFSEVVQTAAVSLKLLGYVYQDCDYLKKPIGHIFQITDEDAVSYELHVPLHVVAATARMVYVCDLGGACIVEPGRRGFTRSQMFLTAATASEAVKSAVRDFFNALNTSENQRKFLIIVTG
jgi:hypothetical protein